MAAAEVDPTWESLVSSEEDEPEEGTGPVPGAMAGAASAGELGGELLTA